MNRGMMSSKRGDWATPRKLFAELDAEFDFTLDACASAANAKCARYFTEADDGLAKEWSGRVWCNPPYGRQIHRWVLKASMSVFESDAELVAMLLPARTDTQWFHRYCYPLIRQVGTIRGEVRFLPGRLYFDDGVERAPFPSMVVIMRGRDR